MAGFSCAARGVTALSLRADVLLAVLLMAALTYLCRAGGLVIRRAVRLPPFAESLLRELPGPLFVAYTAPALAAQGSAGVLAALAVAAVQWRTRNLGAAILAGRHGRAAADDALLKDGADRVGAPSRCRATGRGMAGFGRDELV